MKQLPTTLKGLGKSQRDLAAALGVREETVSRWVNGEVTASAENERAVLTFVRALDPTATREALFGEGEVVPSEQPAPQEDTRP